MYLSDYYTLQSHSTNYSNITLIFSTKKEPRQINTFGFVQSSASRQERSRERSVCWEPKEGGSTSDGSKGGGGGGGRGGEGAHGSPPPPPKQTNKKKRGERGKKEKEKGAHGEKKGLLIVLSLCAWALGGGRFMYSGPPLMRPP